MGHDGYGGWCFESMKKAMWINLLFTMLHYSVFMIVDNEDKMFKAEHCLIAAREGERGP